MNEPIEPGRSMSLDQALAVLAEPAGPCAEACTTCGVPTYWWWTDEQRARHRRYHRAQAAVAAAVMSR